MKDVVLKIVSNEKVGLDCYLMKLEGDLSEIKNSGEFVELSLDKYFLRRPISVHDYTNNSLSLLYKVLGHGTKDMTNLAVGTELKCLTGLGNGFDVTKAKKPLLVAGGIGIAPLYNLAKKFNALGIKPVLVYGARSSADLVEIEKFKDLCDVRLCTDDGSLGYHGTGLAYIKEANIEFDYYYACGPQIMLKFLSQAYPNGCVSLEARMGCGFGACMGCSIKTVNGPKRVCKEGPVFEASEVEF